MAQTLVIADNTYRTGKLSVMEQLHVARRISPLIAAVVTSGGPMVVAAMKSKNPEERAALVENMTDEIGDSFEAMLKDGTSILAKLPDADVEFVINTCMQKVQKKIANDLGWATVWSDNGRPMFEEDLDLFTILRLVFAVVQDNLGNFTSALGQTSPATQATPS